MDKLKIYNFFKSRSLIEDDYVATRNYFDDRLSYDTNLIKKYLKHNSSVLDLGCGSGLISKNIVDLTSNILAVDNNKNFLNRINHSKIITLESDILSFETKEKFDLILIFGLLTFVDETELDTFYSKIEKMLKPNGIIIIKHQCGLKDDVIIDTFSIQLQANYVAIYRNIQKEISILKQFFDVDLIDIYPDTLNNWEDTHHYAFICTSNT